MLEGFLSFTDPCQHAPAATGALHTACPLLLRMISSVQWGDWSWGWTRSTNCGKRISLPQRFKTNTMEMRQGRHPPKPEWLSMLYAMHYANIFKLVLRLFILVDGIIPVGGGSILACALRFRQILALLCHAGP
eukprot:1144196-Pelagomonas_calceolata.AAC.6